MIQSSLCPWLREPSSCQGDFDRLQTQWVVQFSLCPQLWRIFQFLVRLWDHDRLQGRKLVWSSVCLHCAQLPLGPWRGMDWGYVSFLRFRSISSYKTTTLSIWLAEEGEVRSMPWSGHIPVHSWGCQNQENLQPELIPSVATSKRCPPVQDFLSLRPRMSIPHLSDRQEIPILGQPLTALWHRTPEVFCQLWHGHNITKVRAMSSCRA